MLSTPSTSTNQVKSKFISALCTMSWSPWPKAVTTAWRGHRAIILQQTKTHSVQRKKKKIYSTTLVYIRQVINTVDLNSWYKYQYHIYIKWLRNNCTYLSEARWQGGGHFIATERLASKWWQGQKRVCWRILVQSLSKVSRPFQKFLAHK